MLRTLVLDRAKKPLMPCHPARARQLLRLRRAKVFRLYPFTIILQDRDSGEIQSTELRIDPGSKISGIALVASAKRGYKVVFAANLHHRGQQIKDALEARRSLRRSRRNRNTRYRKPRFDNRTRPTGWLPPSLRSRVDNVTALSAKLQRLSPISGIAVETVRFDMQKLQNPEIQGVEYQQGELLGYEVREYLLEKWKRQCAYCGLQNTKLEVEHIVPRSKGGSNRVSNLGLACHPCNQKKGNQALREFLPDKKRAAKILSQAKAPLKDAAAVNATRFAIGTKLKDLGLLVRFFSGGRTKHNRCQQDYPKDHWIDAACVGPEGANVHLNPGATVLSITAGSRGSRQQCRMDKYGFPRTGPKAAKRVHGFQTGDIVKAIVPRGKKQGSYLGRVAVRASGSFNITASKGKTVQGISAKHCRILQRLDGYSYAIKAMINTGEAPVPTLLRRFSPKGLSFPPPPKGGGFQERV